MLRVGDLAMWRIKGQQASAATEDLKSPDRKVGTSPDHRSALRFRGLWIIASVALLCLIAADRQGWLLVRHADDLGAYHGMSAIVVRIIDGDTIDVDIADALNGKSTTRVRL